jgi:hypothetical protein
MKKQNKSEGSEKYRAVLALTRKMFPKDIKSDPDAEGLIADAVLVGLPGNAAFFKDPGNLSGFAVKQSAALKMALALGDIKQPLPLLAADLNYTQIKKLGGLTAAADAPRAAHFKDNPKEKNVLYSFNIYFAGGQATFPAAQYGKDFHRALEQASLFGNAILSVKGHANPADFVELIQSAAVARGAVRQQGGKFVRKDGTAVDMNNMKQVLDLIEKEKLGDVIIHQQGLAPMPAKDFLAFLQRLSEARAQAVRQAVAEYAAANNLRFDESQLKSGAFGGTQPVLTLTHTIDEGAPNRRVEFRIIQVDADDLKPEGGFDF